MLSMNNISRVYRSETIQTHALRDFNLQVDAGEFVAVTGPSGSGKSTFLNVAGLLDEFNEGEYVLDGTAVKGLSDDDLSRLRNEKIGFIFQNYNLIPDYSIYDNVDMPLRYRGLSAKQRRSRIEHALELVGLASRHSYLPSQLSGGQQQRVAIARALAGEPKILLADEPTGNLDSLMARQIMDLLKTINKEGSTIIMVTHDPDQAREVNRNIQIIDGQITDYSIYAPVEQAHIVNQNQPVA
ncbi:ABC transporter ATP-binding protein [Pseudoalteromonas luteoviolacea]|uniref:ABC transporter ATP-binding protein n=1 Tax=Pseudoalteromonas luteoviolacea TaxID=43657 RepID=A0A023PZA5_9GAMM|nr:ABC transporter ATP-binding protein [Pseudoalteromonas luteoviolacea]AHX39939.1 ABC transporter ATP-binding protein [Pseudoalteromonas luteoviolacea]KID56042.1 ABC transporter ATP-binding protein [Pseudoalteromonas luteoviolacea]